MPEFREHPRHLTPIQEAMQAAQANRLERLIALVNPVRAAARMRARVAMALATGSAYTGASRSRRSLSSWNPSNGSADADLLWDLPTLRDRSRDLVRNNPLATGAINTVVTRVIGTGLSLQPAIDHEALGLSRDEAERWQSEVRRRWSAWAESASNWCDVARQQNFYGLQALTMRSALEAGDVFAMLNLLDERGRPNELAVRLIEGERVSNPGFKSDRPDLAGGVARDAEGRPTAYHIMRQHPGNLYGTQREWDLVPAVGANSGRRNVLHVYDPRRPGQSRGVPYLAPVIEALKQLGRYTEAEIDAAVVSSFFTVFTTGQAGEGLDPMVSAVTGETPSRDTRGEVSGNLELSSGLMVDLPDGSDVKFADPSRPNQAFDQFVLAVMRQIGVALEIPFELLVKHFTSSFTAARAALLDFWLFVRHRREWMAATFCQPVYEEWLRLEVASGRIGAPGYLQSSLARQAWSGAYWVGDAMGVLDPQRESAAVEKYLGLGITTLEKECMRFDGSSWMDNHEQRARETTARREAGLEETPPATEAQGRSSRQVRSATAASAKQPARRVLEAIMSEKWAISEQGLNQIVAIAERSHDPEAFRAVLAERGEPLRDTERTQVRDGVAILPIIGPIFRYANLLTRVSGAVSVDVLATDFAAAVRDPAVSAIVLEIDSPGGMIAGVSEFAEMVRAARAEKPVVAYVSNLGASAAYWIASAAGEVVVRDTAEVGSIGVVMQIIRDKDDRVIKFRSSQSPLKQAEPDSEAAQRDYQARIDALATVFIEAVARYRGVSVDTVLSDFGQGSVMIGAEAVRVGMADRLGSLESTIARLNGKAIWTPTHRKGRA